VARVAGVSSATVDRVLNDRDGVRDLTRAHVLSVARQLGYLPPGEGSGRIRLAFLLPAGTNSFIRLLQEQIEQQAATLDGIDTVVETIEGFDPPALADRLHRLRGQMVAPTNEDQMSWYTQLWTSVELTDGIGRGTTRLDGNTVPTPTDAPTTTPTQTPSAAQSVPGAGGDPVAPPGSTRSPGANTTTTTAPESPTDPGSGR